MREKTLAFLSIFTNFSMEALVENQSNEKVQLRAAAATAARDQSFILQNLDHKSSFSLDRGYSFITMKICMSLLTGLLPSFFLSGKIFHIEKFDVESWCKWGKKLFE